MKKLLTLLIILVTLCVPAVAFASEYYYEVPVKVYHYTLDKRCTGKWTKLNKTASGTTPTVNRTIAHATLEFGTKVKIGDIDYIVEDRGAGITGNNVDIFVGTYEEAVELGVCEDVMRVYLPEGVSALTHAVTKGETLSAIANKYNTTVEKIAEANSIENVNSIVVGDELFIPILFKQEQYA